MTGGGRSLPLAVFRLSCWICPLYEAAVGRGCVKTCDVDVGRERDPPECSVSASRHLGKGKTTPENRVVSSFDTASATSGR